jgi:hypothetical protein
MNMKMFNKVEMQNRDDMGTSAICGSRYLYFGTPTIAFIFKWFFASLLYTKFVNSTESEQIFFISRSASKRQDLSEMQILFLASFKSKFSSFGIATSTLKINFRLPLDFIMWSYFYARYPDHFCIKPFGWRNKITSFFGGLHFYSSLHRLKRKSKDIYVFCDSVGLDAAIANLHKLAGSSVTCIQHGQYRFEPNVINSDMIPFLNACGTKIMVWGQATKLEYLRANIPAYDIEIAGKFSTFPKSTLSRNLLSHLCVVLNGPDTAYVNSGLLQLAQEFSLKSGVRISVKKHPADKNDYKELQFSVSDESVSLFLCHSSGFIIESLVMKRRFAILRNNFSPAIFSSFSCQVSNTNDLVDIFRNSTNDYWEQMHRYQRAEFIINV